jgi:hypothetical protein
MHQYLIWTDYCSTALWLRMRGTWANTRAPDVLPPALVERLDYMAAWFDKSNPDGSEPALDWPAYEAYAFGLAVDFKRHFGDDAAIFVEVNDKVVEVTGDPFRMTQPAPSELGWRD